MGIFNRSKQARADKKAEPKKEDQVLTPAATPVEGEAKVSVLVASPRASEKAAIMASKGTYVFNVPTSANKLEVRKAVEKQFKVSVVRVNMLRGEGKVVRRGRVMGRRSSWKKALVTLKAGEKLDLYKGV